MQVAVTKKVSIDQSAGWPEELPVTIYPKHFNLSDRVWLVYVRDMLGDYNVYIGEVVVAGVRREKHLAGANGSLWRYAYYYTVTNAKGNKVLSEYEQWVPEKQVFATKEEALTNMRGATLFVLEQDRKRHSKNLAVTEATIQRVKDSTIELTYASIE